MFEYVALNCVFFFIRSIYATENRVFRVDLLFFSVVIDASRALISVIVMREYRTLKNITLQT